jgi:hypothetical protein
LSWAIATIVNFAAAAAKFGAATLVMGEEMQDAEYKHRARPSGAWQIREDAEFEGNLPWLN